MNSFNLYEDVLSRTWNRYYYEVEAETLEEAIEKVKDGEVDCYDSEQLYESTDDLAPEENNGSATREIYHEDEVVWDNAKLVNRGEIITQDLRNISDQLFHIMESEPEEFSAGSVYHTDRGCASLKARNPKVEEIPLSEARKKGYKPCKRCKHG